MSAMFDFLWTKWDKRFSEIERSIRPADACSERIAGAKGLNLQQSLSTGHNVVSGRIGGFIKNTECAGMDAGYPGEIKELNFKLVRQAAAIDRLKKALEASEQKKAKRDKFLRSGRMRVFFALKKLRLRLKDYRKESIEFKRRYRFVTQKCDVLKEENEFLKTEGNYNVLQMKHYVEQIKGLEKNVTAKEDQLSRIYDDLKSSREANDKLLCELDKSNLEKRMMLIKHEIRKQEAKQARSGRRSALRKWLSKPLVDVEL